MSKFEKLKDVKTVQLLNKEAQNIVIGGRKNTRFNHCDVVYKACKFLVSRGKFGGSIRKCMSTKSCWR